MELVKADITNDDAKTQAIKKDLSRADRFAISTMIMYPAEYPEKPAVLLEGLIGPSDVLKAMDRM